MNQETYEILEKLKLYGIIPVIKTQTDIRMCDSASNTASGNDTEGFSEMKILYVPENLTSVKWNGLGRGNFECFVVAELNKVFQSYEGILYTKKGYDREGRKIRKNMIELVACPTKVVRHKIMDGTKRIANCSFKGCMISDLLIPESVEEIGANAFYMTSNLHSIIIPRSIKRVGPQSHVSFTNIKYGTQSFTKWTEFVEYLLGNGFITKNGYTIKA